MAGLGAPGKQRYASSAFARRFPLTLLNSALARPFSFVFVALRITPNQVTVLSLLTSLAGTVLVATGEYGRACLGAGLVFLGLVLDHADGQVARRTGATSLWGMYLDAVFDRIVEVALFLAIVVAGMRGTVEWDRAGWTALALPDGALAAVAALTLGCVFLGKYVATYGTLLYLREHILAGGGKIEFTPPSSNPPVWSRRLPGYNRDVFLVVWCLAIVASQVPVMLLGLAAIGLLGLVFGVRNFHSRHKQFSTAARAAFDPDFH